MHARDSGARKSQDLSDTSMPMNKLVVVRRAKQILTGVRSRFQPVGTIRLFFATLVLRLSRCSPLARYSCLCGPPAGDERAIAGCRESH